MDTPDTTGQVDDVNAATLDEDEDEEVEEAEPGVAVKKVETTNKQFGKISVSIRVPLAPSVSEYAGEDFYGSEEALKKAIDADWARRKSNAARPVLRDSERELDWQSVAQQTSDQYKPGRRGGFSPTVGMDELQGASSIEDVIALLREKGVNIV